MSTETVNLNFNYRRFQNNKAQYSAGKVVIGAECADGTVKDSAGTVLGSAPSGGEFTVVDSNVQSTLGNYNVNVKATQPHVIPDIDIDVIDQGSNPLGSFTREAAVNQTVQVTISGASATATFNFGTRPTGQDWIFFRAQVDFTLDYSSRVPTNIDILNIYVNNVLTATPSITITAGDRVRMQAIRSNNALASSVDMPVTGVGNNFTIPSIGWFFPRLTNFAATCSEADDEVHGRYTDSLMQANGTVSGFQVSAVSDFVIQSPCEVIYATPNDYVQYWIGLNDQAVVTFPGTIHYNRTRHAIRPFNGPRADVVEYGTFVFTLNVKQFQSWVEVKDDGATVKYYYSNDLGVTWNLYYTSVMAYVSQAYRADFGVNAGITQLRRLPPMCVQS